LLNCDRSTGKHCRSGLLFPDQRYPGMARAAVVGLALMIN
jgi:hypothetical protein